MKRQGGLIHNDCKPKLLTLWMWFMALTDAGMTFKLVFQKGGEWEAKKDLVNHWHLHWEGLTQGMPQAKEIKTHCLLLESKLKVTKQKALVTNAGMRLKIISLHVQNSV